MIRKMWDTEANHRRKTNGMPDSPLSPTGKEAKYGIHSNFVIKVNKVADLGINSGFNHEL